MKKLKWVLLAAMVFTPFAQAADEVINCWDSSFAYTTLSVKDHGDAVVFVFKTQDLSRISTLTGLGVDTWGEGQVMFGFEKTACRFHETEPRVMQCFGVTTIDVQYSPGGNKPKKGERLYGRMTVGTALTERTEVGTLATPHLEAEMLLDQGSGKLGMERLLFPLEDDGQCRTAINSTPKNIPF